MSCQPDRTNRGTIRLGSADDGTNATLTVQSGAKLTNAGTIVSEIVGGEQINGNLDNQGTLQINADTGSDSRNPPGTSIWTSSGAINIAADRTLALSWNASSSFTQTAGTITTIGGTFDQTGGTFAASGNGSQTGDPLQFDGDVTISPSGTGSGTFESRSGNATLGSDIGAGYTLRVAGRANGHEGKLSVPADRTNHGTIDLGGENTQGTLAISTGSTLTSDGSIISTFTGPNSTNYGPNHLSGRVVSSGSITVAEASLDGSADLSTSGTVNVGDGTGSSLSLGSLIQSGDIQIADSSQLSVSGNDTQTAGVTNLNGTHAQLAASALLLQGGTFSGIGTVSATVTNAGLVAPGAGEVTGTLSINGTYTQQAAGDLAIKVTSAGNDLLAVTGAATLDGTLSLSTAGSPPPEGQTYTILTDSTQAGRFATVSGSGYNVVYDPTDVKLVATAPPPPPPPPNPNPNPQPNPNPNPNPQPNPNPNPNPQPNPNPNPNPQPNPNPNPSPQPNPNPQVPAASVDSPSLRNPGSGDGTLKFTITLSAPAAAPASVRYATANATAATPGDYVAATGTVDFAAGETRKTVSVTVHGNPNPGLDRSLFLNLSSPSNATIAVGRGTGIILNDRVSLANVSPTHLGAGPGRTITLRGAGFTGSPKVRLTHPGLPDIVATEVSVGRDGRTLSAVFDLSNASLGVRNVVVTLPTFGASDTLPDAFTIEKPTPPYVEAN